MDEIKPDKILDCKGLMCPMPIIKTKAAIKKLDSQQILEVITTDQGSKSDLTAWSKSTGNKLLKIEEEEGIFRFCFQKK
jgi:TusA-related sulfurtransferase|tara:strand:+ start:567 stop:803 length:237 start_codon:yes stop_codon:yes gene_type:complete